MQSVGGRFLAWDLVMAFWPRCLEILLFGKRTTSTAYPQLPCCSLTLIFDTVTTCRGNGFITDPSIINALQLSDPTSFFNTMITRPWSNQVPPPPPSSPPLPSKSAQSPNPIP